MSNSKTVQENFYDGISEGDWKKIRRVYKAITGETAPQAPEPVRAQDMVANVLNQPMQSVRGVKSEPVNPLEQVMEDDDYDDSEEYVELEAGIHEGIDNGDPAPLMTDDIASEFFIKHNNKTTGPTNEAGKIQCRKESMIIPKDRPQWKDDGVAFANEKVTEHPDDPSLGIQKVSDRTGFREDGVDTSSKSEVRCSLCNKTESVASSLASGFAENKEFNTYKCNKCNTPSGRAKVLREQRNKNNGGSQRSRAT